MQTGSEWFLIFIILTIKIQQYYPRFGITSYPVNFFLLNIIFNCTSKLNAIKHDETRNSEFNKVTLTFSSSSLREEYKSITHTTFCQTLISQTILIQ